MRFTPFALLAVLFGAPLPALAVAPHASFAAYAQAPQPNLVDTVYLGVMTESIPLQRASDLQLPPGTGLSILGVAPGSPAEKAGLKKDDVLTQLGDQILVNPAQLRVLMRLQKAGENVTLKLVRQGKAQAIKVMPEAKQLPELAPGGEEPHLFFPQRGGAQGPGNFHVIPFGTGQLTPEILEQLPKELREHFNHHPNQKQPPKVPNADEDGENLDALLNGDLGDGSLKPNTGLNFSSRVMSNDGTHTITIEHGQREHLSIVDKDGNKLYDGALPTDDKGWEKVPKVARAKARALAGNTKVHTNDNKAPTKDADKPGQSF